MAKKNPPWSRDELILALNLYMSHRRQLPSVNSQAIAQLSKALRQLSPNPLTSEDDYRNPNGVYLKLNNFRSLDPAYKQDGRVGMSHGGKGDKVVWDIFGHNPEQLSSVAAGIVVALAKGISASELEIPEAVEGAILTRWHTVRERDTSLVNKKRKRSLTRPAR